MLGIFPRVRVVFRIQPWDFVDFRDDGGDVVVMKMKKLMMSLVMVVMMVVIIVDLSF